MKYGKKYLKKINEWNNRDSNHSFLSRHPEIERFAMQKTFYFRYLPERETIHWAIIRQKDNKVYIYYINNWGRIFDMLEVKSVKIAQRRLRRNGFDYSTNRYCPFTPPEPIYIQLSIGKHSAPYSKGNLWQSVQRNKKHIDKIEKNCIKHIAEYYERYRNWVYHEKVGMPADIHKIMSENDLPTAYNIIINRNAAKEAEAKTEFAEIEQEMESQIDSELQEQNSKETPLKQKNSSADNIISIFSFMIYAYFVTVIIYFFFFAIKYLIDIVRHFIV